MSKIIDTIELAADICEILQNSGHQAVFCGGCVRDLLLGIEPNDIDIATSANPNQVQALFPRNVEVGKSFGVIRVIHEDEEFEIATFRKDSKSGDGRRPDSVEFSSMEEDAKRRDLTINGMFLDPIENVIHDFVGGQEDLKCRQIRLIGNPLERIEEDKLRLLRVIRFASRGGWVMNKGTYEAVIQNADQISVVSKERIGEELTKILTHKSAAKGYELLNELRFLEILNLPANLRTFNMLKSVANDLNRVLAWSIICRSEQEPQIISILEGLRFDSKTVKSVVNTVRLKHELCLFKQKSVAERTKILIHSDFETAMKLFELNVEKEAVEFVRHFQKSTPISQLKPESLVTGKDLIAMGFKPNSKFKIVLEFIDEQQREGKITDKDAALSEARKKMEEVLKSEI